LRALSRNPAARHPTIRDMRNELRELLGFDARATATAALPALDVQAARESQRRLAAEREQASRSPRSEGTDPEWLERGGHYLAPSAPSVVSAAAPAPTPAAAQPSRSPPTQREIASWMREIAQTTDPAAFAGLVQRVEAKVRSLAEHGDAGALSALATALEVVAMEGPPLPKSRAARARELLRLFKDPQLLGLNTKYPFAGCLALTVVALGASAFGCGSSDPSQAASTDDRFQKAYTVQASPDTQAATGIASWFVREDTMGIRVDGHDASDKTLLTWKAVRRTNQETRYDLQMGKKAATMIMDVTRRSTIDAMTGLKRRAAEAAMNNTARKRRSRSIRASSASQSHPSSSPSFTWSAGAVGKRLPQVPPGAGRHGGDVRVSVRSESSLIPPLGALLPSPTAGSTARICGRGRLRLHSRGPTGR
jgi:hypothetical protein